MGFGPVRWRSWQAAAGPWSAAAGEAQAAGRRVNDAGERFELLCSNETEERHGEGLDVTLGGAGNADLAGHLRQGVDGATELGAAVERCWVARRPASHS